MLQNPLANFTYKKSLSGNFCYILKYLGISIPTSLDWMLNSKGVHESIVCGYSDSLNLVVFDVASVKISN